jgi:hypothetical protein
VNIVDRAKNMILKPKQEWQVIDGETHTVKDLYLHYAMILAAIPAWPRSSASRSWAGRPAVAVPHPDRIGRRDDDREVRAVARLGVRAGAHHRRAREQLRQPEELHAGVEALGLFNDRRVARRDLLDPAALSILGLLGLYSLYVLFLGLPILMKTPEDKVVPYFVVILIAAVVVHVVIGALAALTIPGTLRGF